MRRHPRTSEQERELENEAIRRRALERGSARRQRRIDDARIKIADLQKKLDEAKSSGQCQGCFKSKLDLWEGEIKRLKEIVGA